ncbi:AlpA family phage regulatory protein [Paracoccus marcusii]|nr:AlpA family phage regulatory protein [Paracoccus marcusii]
MFASATKGCTVYLSDKQVASRYNVTRPTVWRWVKADPTFPKPISLSPGCTRWRLDEIESWEAARRAA